MFQVEFQNRPSRKPKPTNPFRVRQTFDTFSHMWSGMTWGAVYVGCETPDAEWIPFGIMNTPPHFGVAWGARGRENRGRKYGYSRCECHQHWEYCMLIAKNKVKQERQQFRNEWVFSFTLVQKYFNCFGKSEAGRANDGMANHINKEEFSEWSV